ncbi:MAG: helix-turn-helix domain-containing protein [Bacteroidetes bacterium]|nr:helix-turn-helix domain-containing protein [Bacteroidota bacterium]
MNKTASTYRNITCRLLPGSQGKAKKLADSAGACRFVWNAILAQQNEAYGKAKSVGDQSPSVSFFSLGKRFTALRGKVEWLPEYSFKVVRYTLKYHADNADLNAAASILVSWIRATARRGAFALLIPVIRELDTRVAAQCGFTRVDNSYRLTHDPPY